MSSPEIHHSITLDRVIEAVEGTMFGIGSTGFCTACGEEQEGCEPDARNYLCEGCEECEVFGAEELLLQLA